MKAILLLSLTSLLTFVIGNKVFSADYWEPVSGQAEYWEPVPGQGGGSSGNMVYLKLKPQYTYSMGSVNSLSDLGIGTWTSQIYQAKQIGGPAYDPYKGSREIAWLPPDDGIKRSFDDKTIYGEDDLIDYYQIPKEEIKLNSHAVAGISNNSERSVHARSFCTAFLVGKDLAITAAHCVNGQDFSSKVLRFDDHLTGLGFPAPTLDTYDIASVEVWDFNYDLALMKLKKNLNGEWPGDKHHILKLSKDEMKKGTALYLIGHPGKEYKKFVGNCSIVTPSYIHPVGKFTFGCDCDGFGGMSGSPVFDVENNNVVGIFWGGQHDQRTIPKGDDNNHEFVVPMWQIAKKIPHFTNGTWPDEIPFAGLR